MDRTQDMREYLKPYLVKQMQKKAIEVKKEKNDKLLLSIGTLLEKALKRQEIQNDWLPAYMGLFHFLTGLVTEDHEYEIMIADEQLYLDRSKESHIWYPDFIYFDDGEKEIKKILQSRFYRLNDYEIMYMKRWLFYEYRNLIGVYWKEQINEVLKCNEFKSLNKHDTFSFLFGDYMGKTYIVLNYEGV